VARREDLLGEVGPEPAKWTSEMWRRCPRPPAAISLATLVAEADDGVAD
jgi:hypothetical protein